MAARLVESGLAKNVADIYYLTKEQIAAQERLGEKSAAKFIKQIENSKSRPLANLIFGLGVRHVGAETAALLAKHFHNLES